MQGKRKKRIRINKMLKENENKHSAQCIGELEKNTQFLSSLQREHTGVDDECGKCGVKKSERVECEMIEERRGERDETTDTRKNVSNSESFEEKKKMRSLVYYL